MLAGAGPAALLLTQPLLPDPLNLRCSFHFSPCPLRRRHGSRSAAIVAAGRPKKPPNKSGRIEGGGDIRREAKSRARVRSRRLAENAFYRRNRRSKSSQADDFTEDELQMIGLGYDRMVRFFSGPDDPRLRHPHDWYRYGEFGPYSWRGIVVGPPLRAGMGDDGVTLIGEVRDQEDWEHTERFDMAKQFSIRVEQLDASVGIRYYWVFARHPNWRSSEKPWVQWTLVSEVAVQAAPWQRLDKWNLMGRLGNKTRSMITKCASWERPDIIYVKKPIYQSRFEPQEDFMAALFPLLDPATENENLFDLHDGGRVVRTTYFGGLCRIVKASPKAYVDDVVNAYSKLSDADKARCLEFLLSNHPIELLHPFTKEWKAKLEEMDMGCDAPDESDDEVRGDDGTIQITDWIEDDGVSPHADDEYENDDLDVVDVANEDEAEGKEMDPEETEEYWNEQWKKAVKSSGEMEKFVEKRVKASNKRYMKQMEEFESNKVDDSLKAKIAGQNEDPFAADSKQVNDDWETDPELIEKEWESAGYKFRKRAVKSKVPPESFLRAAVRPFNYRNLVKEIVLMRHAILDGDIALKSPGLRSEMQMLKNL